MCCDHSAPQQGGSPSSVTVGGWIHRLWTHRYAQRDPGLATLVLQNYQMDPSDSSLFLFCGKSRSQLKALLWEPDGFILLSKQLSNGRYQWPRTAAEVQKLTWEQFTWLMQGLSVEQPKAIRPSPPKKLV